MIIGPKPPTLHASRFLETLINAKSQEELTEYLIEENNKLSQCGKLFGYTDEAINKYENHNNLIDK